MPRLELLAALILSRLMQETRGELEKVIDIDQVTCLTDAEIVLNWVQNEDKEYKQFVQNRMTEIRKRIPIESWFHVPGTENISDLPSRGCFPKTLEDNGLKKKCLEGPVSLRKSSEKWPIRKEIKHQFEESEVKKATCLQVQKSR